LPAAVGAASEGAWTAAARPGENPSLRVIRRAYVSRMTIGTAWRGTFGNEEVNRLHAEAFGTRVFSADEWDWERLARDHSLGWVVARRDGELVGFANVLWDGLVHAWLQDVMVALPARRTGLGVELVRVATTGARAAGCEWLHVDFDPHLRPFYLDACGFTPTTAGLMRL
jgi:GNAT superfamily N-acetyltransferase